MKTVLAAGLLVAKTPIRAYICGNGASALTFVIFVGITWGLTLTIPETFAVV